MTFTVTIAYETKAGDINVATFDAIEADTGLKAIPVAAKRAHAEDADYLTIISGTARPNPSTI